MSLAHLARHAAVEPAPRRALLPTLSHSPSQLPATLPLHCTQPGPAPTPPILILPLSCRAVLALPNPHHRLGLSDFLACSPPPLSPSPLSRPRSLALLLALSFHAVKRLGRPPHARSRSTAAAAAAAAAVIHNSCSALPGNRILRAPPVASFLATPCPALAHTHAPHTLPAVS